MYSEKTLKITTLYKLTDAEKQNIIKQKSGKKVPLKITTLYQLTDSERKSIIQRNFERKENKPISDNILDVKKASEFSSSVAASPFHVAILIVMVQ